MAGNEDRPLCKCHGEPMYRDGSRNGEQEWCCAAKSNERGRRFREANRDKVCKANSRRLWSGDIYLGRVGFTTEETEAMLSGASD